MAATIHCATSSSSSAAAAATTKTALLIFICSSLVTNLSSTIIRVKTVCFISCFSENGERMGRLLAAVSVCEADVCLYVSDFGRFAVGEFPELIGRLRLH